MASDISIRQEANCADWTDEQLVVEINYLRELVARLLEAKKSDSRLEELKQELKDYAHDNYDKQLRTWRNTIKAYSRNADARGLPLKAWKQEDTNNG